MADLCKFPNKKIFTTSLLVVNTDDVISSSVPEMLQYEVA